MKHIKLKIKTNSQDYQIVIGSNLIKELSKILKSNSIKFRNCLLIIDKKIPKKKILDVKKSLRKKNVTTFFIKANENNKNIQSVNKILEILLKKTSQEKTVLSRLVEELLEISLVLLQVSSKEA